MSHPHIPTRDTSLLAPFWGNRQAQATQEKERRYTSTAMNDKSKIALFSTSIDSQCRGIHKYFCWLFSRHRLIRLRHHRSQSPLRRRLRPELSIVSIILVRTSEFIGRDGDHKSYFIFFSLYLQITEHD